jgi:small ubiquitin-related modifier
MGDEEKKEGGEHINLKVVTQDGNEIYFKCKQTTPLQKLMHAFCNRQGVSTNSVRFLFDGNRINETQTPAQVCCPTVAWSLSCAAALHSRRAPIASLCPKPAP